MGYSIYNMYAILMRSITNISQHWAQAHRMPVIQRLPKPGILYKVTIHSSYRKKQFNLALKVVLKSVLI